MSRVDRRVSLPEFYTPSGCYKLALLLVRLPAALLLLHSPSAHYNSSPFLQVLIVAFHFFKELYPRWLHRSTQMHQNYQPAATPPCCCRRLPHQHLQPSIVLLVAALPRNVCLITQVMFSDYAKSPQQEFDDNPSCFNVILTRQLLMIHGVQIVRIVVLGR